MPDPHKVLFRFRPPRPVSYVDLRGDMFHWLEPKRMRSVGDDFVEAEFDLDVGTYEYKFHLADGDWSLDPKALTWTNRTRGAAGRRIFRSMMACSTSS